MAVEVQVAADLNEPGATARATGHIAGDGDHITAPMLPESAERTLAGLSGIAIERIPSGIATGIERLIDRLIISPTGATDQVGQDTLAIGSNDTHAKVMMIVIRPRAYPSGMDLWIATVPAA